MTANNPNERLLRFLQATPEQQAMVVGYALMTTNAAFIRADTVGVARNVMIAAGYDPEVVRHLVEVSVGAARHSPATNESAKRTDHGPYADIGIRSTVSATDNVTVASVTLSGGTCNFDGSATVGVLSLSGSATLGGSKVVTVTNLTWTAGLMAGVGRRWCRPGAVCGLTGRPLSI